MVVHQADCPEVRRIADLGRLVITMLGCERSIPKHLKQHKCLKEK